MTLAEVPLTRWCRPQARRSEDSNAEDTRLEMLPDGLRSSRRLNIKTAHCATRRSLASRLLETRYMSRGYRATCLPSDASVSHFSLVALEAESLIGTITVAMDGPDGLAADHVFGDELAALRHQGHTLCEFTKLAIDRDAGNKSVLAALFHVAYIVAHRMRGFDSLVIEVNPRHVRFYQRMLGMQLLGGERMNRRVNAPAMLLGCRFKTIADQIARLGGQPELLERERSLYPLAFSRSEEASIISRLRAVQHMHEPVSAAPARRHIEARWHQAA